MSCQPSVARRHHGQGTRFYPHFRQGDPAVAPQLWRYFPVERILVKIATAPLLFGDCSVFDPYLIGKPFHWPFQQGRHDCGQTRMVGDLREHLLLAGWLLNAARQRAAPGGCITAWIEHLEMPLTASRASPRLFP